MLAEAIRRNTLMGAGERTEDELIFDNVKHEVILIEFKLVLDRRTLNSVAFLNLPV